MSAFLIFIVLPVLLIVAAFFIKPLRRDRKHGDPFGGSMAAGGMFGGHGLPPDEQRVPEETEAVRFRLEDVKERE